MQRTWHVQVRSCHKRTSFPRRQRDLSIHFLHNIVSAREQHSQEWQPNQRHLSNETHRKREMRCQPKHCLPSCCERTVAASRQLRLIPHSNAATAHANTKSGRLGISTFGYVSPSSRKILQQLSTSRCAVEWIGFAAHAAKPKARTYSRCCFPYIYIYISSNRVAGQKTARSSDQSTLYGIVVQPELTPKVLRSRLCHKQKLHRLNIVPPAIPTALSGLKSADAKVGAVNAALGLNLLLNLHLPTLALPSSPAECMTTGLTSITPMGTWRGRWTLSKASHQRTAAAI